MPSILLVDDSGLFRNVAAEVLKRTGCEALSADGGTEALDVVRREKPSMLVVRAGMKGMTGMDIASVLEGQAPRRLERMVFMTGGAFVPQAAEFVAAHSEQCVGKPFDAAEETLRRLAPSS